MQTWDYGEGRAALYSEDPAIWKAAADAGLKKMAEYHRPDGVRAVRRREGEGAGAG